MFKRFSEDKKRLEIPFLGHLGGEVRSEVLALRYSPDSKVLAAGYSEDKTVKLWDIQKQKLLCTLNGHKEGVRALAYSPDGQILASGSWDGTIKLWNIRTHELLYTLNGHTSGITSLMYSPDGRMLASTCTRDVTKLWDTKTYQLSHTLQGGHFTYLSDDKRFASTSYNKVKKCYTINLWNTDGYVLLKELSDHTEAIEDLVCSPDGKILAIASGDGTVKLWDIETSELLGTLNVNKSKVINMLGGTDYVCQLAYSPNGKILATCSFWGALKLYDMKTLTKLVNLGHVGRVLAYSPDGAILAANSAGIYFSGRTAISLWDTSSLMSEQGVSTSIPFLPQDIPPPLPTRMPIATSAAMTPPPLSPRRAVHIPIPTPISQALRIRTPSPISPQAQGIVSTIMQDNARQLMTGDMAEQFNALQKLLEEQSQQLNHFKQTQSMMMDRQLTQQDTVIAENRSESLANDVRIQQLEQLSQQQGRRNGAIEQELSELKAQQAVLWQEYEIAQGVKAEQQFIARSPCLLLCYLRLQTKLNEWFVGNQAALSGSVQMSRSQTATEQVVNSDTAVGLLTSGIEPCLNLLGDLLPSFPLPGASFFITKLQGLVSGHIDKKVQKKMSHISELMVSVTRMERLTERLARCVVLYYKLGLEQLIEASAGDLGEWCVKPVIAYLYQTDDGHLFDEEILVQVLFDTIKQAGLSQPQKSMIEKMLPAALSDAWKKFKFFLEKDATVALRSGAKCSIKTFLTEGIQVAGQSTTFNSFERKKIAQLDLQHSGLANQVELLHKTADIAGSARVKALLEEQRKEMQAAHEAQLKQLREQQEVFQRQILAQMSGSGLASARSPSPPHLASSASASSLPVPRPRPPVVPRSASSVLLTPPVPAPRSLSPTLASAASPKPQPRPRPPVPPKPNASSA